MVTTLNDISYLLLSYKFDFHSYDIIEDFKKGQIIIIFYRQRLRLFWKRKKILFEIEKNKPVGIRFRISIEFKPG